MTLYALHVGDKDQFLPTRDAGAIFVSRTGSGPAAWAIAEFNLRSVAIGKPR